MTRKHLTTWREIDDALAAEYRRALEVAWPGVRVIEFTVGSWPDAHPFAVEGPHVWLRVSAPEAVLVAYGLVRQATLDTLSRGGKLIRRAIQIDRGKTRTRVEGYFVQFRVGGDESQQVIEIREQLEAAMLAVLVPTYWRPSTRRVA